MKKLSVLLKESTKENHRLLESKMIKRIRAITTKDDYTRLLNLFYTFFGGLEAQVNLNLEKDFFQDITQRRKAGLLAADLFTPTFHLPEFAGKAYLPKVSTSLHAVGVMYVMEGSTMGGGQIVKMIAKQLNLKKLPNQYFFEGYKENTQAMWDNFKETIDKKIPATPDQHIVVKSANDTFLTFSKWFDHQAMEGVR